MAQAQARENIEIVEYMTMVDLISADNICGGVVAMDEQDEIYEISAPYVVLACGGLSYQATGSTGDGMRMAQELGHSLVPCMPSLVLPIFRILQEMLWELP